MTKVFFQTVLVFSIAIGSQVYAQQTAAPGSGDKDLRDNNVKSRSIDLERTERDARKNDANQAPTNKAASAEDRLAIKYAEIKTDYEQIQLSQDAIIKTYQGVGKIDYAQIGKSAAEIGKSAVRLELNLFSVPSNAGDASAKPEAEVNEKTEKIEKASKPSKSLRDLIVELDNSIGAFATSPMFQNLRTIDAAVAAKAKLDLEEILELSAALEAEARKLADDGK